MGFVPKSLTYTMAPYLPRKDSLEFIGIIDSKATDIFYENVWINRCRIFAKHKKSLGIEYNNKINVSSHNSTITCSHACYIATPSQR